MSTCSTGVVKKMSKLVTLLFCAFLIFFRSGDGAMINYGYKIVEKFFDQFIPELTESSVSSCSSSLCGSLEDDFFLMRIDSVSYEVNPDNLDRNKKTEMLPELKTVLSHPTVTDYVVYGSQIISKSEADALMASANDRKRTLSADKYHASAPHKKLAKHSVSPIPDFDSEISPKSVICNVSFKNLKCHKKGMKDDFKTFKSVSTCNSDKIEFIDLENGMFATVISDDGSKY